jgi:hypothetical protein
VTGLDDEPPVPIDGMYERTPYSLGKKRSVAIVSTSRTAPLSTAFLGRKCMRPEFPSAFHAGREGALYIVGVEGIVIRMRV